MKAIIILYKLKADVTPDDFENWIKQHDYPAMRALASVKSFTTYRSEKLLMAEGSPSHDYVEVFDISDLEEFINNDMLGETVQGIMGQFIGFAQNPEFIIAEAVI